MSDRIDAAWLGFARTGDEWLCAYFDIERNLRHCAAPWLFAASHTLELFLKAGLIRSGATPEEAIAYKHRLFELWIRCSGLPEFPFRVRLIETCKNLCFIDEAAARKTVALNEYKHFLSLQSLYVALAHTMNLKYFGSMMKGVRYPISYAYVIPDLLMGIVLRRLHRWLDHDNFILSELELGGQSVAAYLGELPRCAHIEAALGAI